MEAMSGTSFREPVSDSAAMMVAAIALEHVRPGVRIGLGLRRGSLRRLLTLRRRNARILGRVPNVQRILNASATGLAVLMLLALGTFTAGVHVLSWQVCLLGIIMALCVPAAAWIEASALIIVLVSIAALGIGVVLWWHWHESRAQKA
jgi:hypothetical protein